MLTFTRRGLLSGAAALGLIPAAAVAKPVTAEPEIIPPKPELERGVYIHVDGTRWRCTPTMSDGTPGYIDFMRNRGFMLIRVEPEGRI